MAESIHTHEQPSTVVNENDHTESTINEDEEEKHFRKVIGAFLYYK